MRKALTTPLTTGTQPATRAEEQGLALKPKWVKGAKVFVAGVGPSDMEEVHIMLRKGTGEK